MMNVNTGISSTVVFWLVPTPTDNSGQARIIFNTHNPGDIFFVGTTAVSYIAQDGFGNIGSCTFSVIVSTGKLNTFLKDVKVNLT